MREIIETVDAWRKHGERIAVATVLAAGGSTPRPTGAKMAVTASGRMAGSISGGCVDTDVIEHAIEVLRDGRPQIVEYGYVPDMSWEIGLMCGGSVQVYIEPLEPWMVGEIEETWVTDLVEQSGEAACGI